MSISKSIAREIIFPLLLKTGLEKILRKTYNNNKLIVMYHGVSDNPDKMFNGRHLDAKQFEKHLMYFKKNFNIIPLTEIFELYRTNERPKKPTIAITFDDCYENNYTVALPLLEKYNFPATFYVISASLEDKNYILWPDMIDSIKYADKSAQITFDNNLFSGINLYSETLNINLFEYVKNMGEERDRMLNDLKRKVNLDKILEKVPRDYWKLITEEQLKQFSKSPLVEIGSHTHSHYDLGDVDSSLMENELKKSKKLIESCLGKNVSSIAYPYGGYNKTTKSLALKAGYTDTVAVDYKCADDSTDLNILPRFGISNTTTFESNMLFLNLAFGKKGF